MYYNKSIIEAKLKLGESETLEFQPFIKDPMVLSRLIGSFANREGGMILVGIREPMEIIGCDIKKLKNVFEIAKSMVKPAPVISLEPIQFDEIEIGVIKVEKSNEIVFAGGSVFERVGLNTIAMNSQSIKGKLSQVSTTISSDLLAKSIEQQTKIIEDLRAEIRNSNFFKSNLKVYIMVGAIGALVGLGLTLLFLNAF